MGLDTASFNEALRRALRQDPDVILIGEMRDAETAQTAMQAAESGHLVLSTLHTTDAAETVGRIVEFFPSEKHQQVRSILAGVLRGVDQSAAAATYRLRTRRGRRVDGHECANRRPDPGEPGGRDREGDRRRRLLQDADVHQALIDLVLAEAVDTETAADAAGNRHDFLVALDRTVKARAERSARRRKREVAGDSRRSLRLVQPGDR